MTFSELKTEFTNRSDDTVDDSQIGQWINQSLHEVYGSTEILPFTSLKSKDVSQTTISGTGSYSLPSGFLKPVKLYVGIDEYTRVDYEDTVDTSQLDKRYAVTSSTQYTIYPTPNTTGTQISLFYEVEPADLSVASEEPLFNERFHEILVYGALKRYHEREKEMSKAAFYQAEFQNVLANLRDFYTRYSKDDVLRMHSLMEGFDY